MMMGIKLSVTLEHKHFLKTDLLIICVLFTFYVLNVSLAISEEYTKIIMCEWPLVSSQHVLFSLLIFKICDSLDFYSWINEPLQMRSIRDRVLYE